MGARYSSISKAKEDTTMTKKEYMKPTMRVVELQHRTMILAGSLDANGMNRNIVTNEEVDEAW